MIAALKKKNRRAMGRNSSQKKKSDKPESKQIERNRDGRGACRNTSSRRKSSNTWSRRSHSWIQKPPGCSHRSAYARHGQEVASQSYLLRHRLHLVDAVVTLTITYGAGTRTTTKEFEKMLRTTSAGCFVSSFRQIEHTKRKTQKSEMETSSKMTK